MAHTNTGIISAPVSFADVNAVLGTRHTDLGNLCKDSHINKWARYKPFSAPILGLPTESQRQDYYYGLLPPLMNLLGIVCVERERFLSMRVVYGIM